MTELCKQIELHECEICHAKTSAVFSASVNGNTFLGCEKCFKTWIEKNTSRPGIQPEIQCPLEDKETGDCQLDKEPCHKNNCSIGEHLNEKPFKYLTVAEYSKLKRVTVRVVRTEIKKGRIKAEKIGKEYRISMR